MPDPSQHLPLPPLTTLEAAAASMREMYNALLAADFNPDEALKLLAYMAAANVPRSGEAAS